MKRAALKAFALILLAVIACSVFSGCIFLRGSGNKLMKEYAGTYKHEWSIMLMYGSGHGDGHDRDETITLKSDGTGSYAKSGMSPLKIKWTVDEDGNMTMKETGIISFGGEYHGSFASDGSLHFYDGDESDTTTVEYMFKKVG